MEKKDERKTVLVVEYDLEERKIACAALKELGLNVVAVETYADANRIWDKLGFKLETLITVLLIPEFPFNHPPEKLPKDQLFGLGLVARAVKQGLPVVICCDTNHHRVDHIRAVLEVFVSHPNYPFDEIPMILDKKDWFKAGKALLNLIEKKYIKV